MRYFKDITCPALRAWNQIHQALELAETRSDEVAERYFDGLTKPEQQNFTVIATRIAVRGRDFVQKEIMNYK